MLEGGLSILTGITTAIIENIPVLMPAIVQMMMMLVQFVVESLPLLLTAAVEIIMALANGIANSLPQLIPTILGIIPVIINTLLENLPLLLNAALQIIIALIQGLVAALPDLIAYVPELIVAIFDAIIEALPVIGEAAVEIIVALVNGLISAIPQVIDAVKLIWEGMKLKFSELWEEIKTVGTDIVRGIWEGIKEKATWLYDQVKTFFQNLFKSIQEEEEISSPSKKWARMGGYMAAGLGQGFTQQMGVVEGQIAGAVAGLNGISASPSINLQSNGMSGNGGVAGSTGAGNTFQYVFNFKDSTLTEAELERILARQEALYGAG
jgi:phage-related protein